MGRHIKLIASAGDGAFGAYLAEPEGAVRGGIVVVQEIFGINKGIRKQVDDWAARGYVALAPDLFWRSAPGLELDADRQEDWPTAIGHMQKFDMETGLSDLRDGVAAARRLGGGKVGVVGYCLGGTLAFLVAARGSADAVVGYYGGGIAGMLPEGAALATPLMLHFGKADQHIPPDARRAVHDALDANPHVEIHDYDGQDHAFARAFGSSRNEAAADLADARTEQFVRAHIG